MQSKSYRAEILAFYSSKEWKQCRTAYKKQKRYICERCGQTTAKMIVHHKIHLNDGNICDPSVAFNSDNLELLCIDCHNKEHFKDKKEKRYEVGPHGEIVTLPLADA